jgi:hypothetical protein
MGAASRRDADLRASRGSGGVALRGRPAPSYLDLESIPAASAKSRRAPHAFGLAIAENDEAPDGLHVAVCDEH